MGGRDHSCEGCGRGGFNDPDGVCECPTADALAREPRWTISGVEVVPASSLQEVGRERDELREALRGPIHGRIQTARGWCSDEVPYPELDAYLATLDDIVAALSNPKEEQ